MVEIPSSAARPSASGPALGAKPRLGPRPLAQHLMTAGAVWLNAGAVLPSLSAAWANSKLPEPSEKSLAREIAAADPAQLQAALALEGRRRFDLWFQGVEAYRRHPHRRSPDNRPVLWSEGTTRLLDYSRAPGNPSLPPLLVIPSLVNRYYVLDLEPDCSFLDWLGAAGFAPYVVDWGVPGAIERDFSLTDYIAGRLDRALSYLRRKAGQPVFAIGYCMGGNLALALALRRARDIAGLVLLATPWDFQAGDPLRGQGVAAFGESLAPIIGRLGELPVDWLQIAFAALDPVGGLRKFQNFAGIDPQSSSARRFVALEDWLNDGIALAGPVARECFAGWYGGNEPARGRWRIAGEIVDPALWRKPSLVVIPGADRIVPPDSALALARALKGAEIERPPLGHIGMMVGGKAESQVWAPLGRWLEKIAALPATAKSS